MTSSPHKYQVSDLLNTAERVFETYANPDHHVSAIEAYAAVFDNFFRDEGVINGLTPDEISSIQSAHSRVMEVADRIKNEASAGLKGLMVKGKATLKYIDHLPRRISVTKTHLG